jgi:hypothetical protein
MKPLKGDQQRSVSLSYSVARQALKSKPSPRRRRGLDASPDRGLTERSGEVFLLDILSHRMSVMAIYRQLNTPEAESFGVEQQLEMLDIEHRVRYPLLRERLRHEFQDCRSSVRKKSHAVQLRWGLRKYSVGRIDRRLFPFSPYDRHLQSICSPSANSPSAAGNTSWSPAIHT